MLTNQEGVAITDCAFEVFAYKEYQNACDKSLLLNRIGRTELEY